MSREFGIRNAECGISRDAMSQMRLGVHRRRCIASRLLSFRIPQSAFRNGVTLIELLITVTIIAILSAVFLGASRSAMETARAARTKTTITKIHGLLMERWNSYTTRRVDISSGVLQDIEQEFRDGNILSRQRGQMLADARLFATRELMKLEMPDRWSDVLNLNGNWPSGDPRNAELLPSNLRMLPAFPGLTRAYHRRLQSLKKDDLAIIQDNEGAECLYMIVMLATGDGEARSLFKQSDIGDVDDDGAPEFLDGWGRPIKFIRWPAGFVMQSSLMNGDGDEDHDPFDPFQRDLPESPRPDPSRYPSAMRSLLLTMEERHLRVTTPIEPDPPFLTASRLVPLIFSSGPDQNSDVNVSVGAVTLADPYIDKYGLNGRLQLGAPDEVETGWIDNIHNHLQDNR